MIPVVGFGTYKLYEGTYDAVIMALQAGYRHIDTAVLYRNEKAVGDAIRDSKVSRSDIFVTSKVLDKDQKLGRVAILEAFGKSLRDLDYVDLLLLHNPIRDRYLDGWKVLEELYMEGKCRMIGVSNFDIKHLELLLQVAKVKPIVNQIELSPFSMKRDLVKFCREKGIIVVAHSCLVRGLVLKNTVVVKLAEKYGVSSAQILLKWGLQSGFVVLTRSKDIIHIKENIALNYVIDEDDMLLLDSLDGTLSDSFIDIYM